MGTILRVLATLYILALPGCIIHAVITKSFVLISGYALFTLAVVGIGALVMALVMIWGDT